MAIKQKKPPNRCEISIFYSFTLKKKPKMKKILLLTFSLLFSLIAFCQDQGKTFYLKNGSIITGIVIEEIPGKEYKVKTSDGNVFVLKADEIEKIVLVEKQNKVQKMKESLDLNHTFFTNNGLSIGGMFSENYESYNFALTTINGIKLNNSLALGLGLEYQKFKNGYYLPVYLNVQWNLSENPSTFFTNVGGGFAVSGNRENIKVINPFSGEYEVAIKYSNGIYGKFGFGYQRPLTKQTNMYLTLNYSLISYDSRTWLYDDVFLENEGIYSLVSIKFGIEYNFIRSKKSHPTDG